MTAEVQMRWDPGQDMEDWDGAQNSAKLFERSRIKALAEERESVQKKTFCKWVNSHLSRVGSKISDLYIDLRDGRMLIKLLEVLSGEKLPRPTKGKMRIHCLENVDKALAFLYECRVHLENIGAHDIVDGSPALTLGLIWTIILRFQIQDITIEEVDSSETRSAKDALLLWCQMKTAGYPNVNVRNFTTSWRDGMAFNALIHKHRPDLIQIEKLQKSNALHNLGSAFTVADEKLGLTPLLEPEDVNVEFPDEKSIITYVVTYYHYFSKMKAESVQGRRVAKVVQQALESEGMAQEYETLTSDLLEWIKQTIEILNDRQFANSLSGVKQQLAAFNTYRQTEKPPKFEEKGNLEVMLFTLQSQMRANNQKPYTPTEGKLISDTNRAWEELERAEHERELALREELIRQEKLEQLAARFDRKAGMRETWLSENQRLVAQDNFGQDLPAVEAATKKHEAIETDIFAYEERVMAVVNVAQDLEREEYHDIERINQRKENVLRLWNYLLELLKARRMRLELSLNLQKVFQEMLYILDWMEEIKARLLSEDYGKHLMGVEDLLQKHSLLEADISVVGERVRTVNAQAQSHAAGEFTDAEGYRPCEPEVIEERMSALEAAYEQLLELAAERRARLEESRRMWQFYWNMADEESWIREKEQLMQSPELGHDLSSVRLLVSKHKAAEDEMSSRHAHLQSVIQVGDDLIDVGNLGSDQIQQRIDEINGNWETLLETAANRKKKLLDYVDYHQLFADADDIDAWMMDTYRLVSSDDVGRDEASVRSLIRKHRAVIDELESYRSVVDGLHEQANALPDEERESAEVQGRLGTIDKRYEELLQLARERQVKLENALALYQLFNEADSLETWVEEKDKLLGTMVPARDDVEEVEILKHRFNTFDQEMKNTNDKLDTVNQLAEQLLSAEHPDHEQIVARQQTLADKWKQLDDQATQRRDAINLAHAAQNFNIETDEANTWIDEKAKLIESTDEIGDDLAGIMTLQRRLSTMERDLAAIESKMAQLDDEAEKLEAAKPEEAEAIRAKMTTIHENWERMKQMLKEREDRLGQADELQHFLRDLDHFQSWLKTTTTTIASEDAPETLTEAEELLNQHHQLRDEIESYKPEFERLMEYGEKITEGQDDPQFIFLRERMNGLREGWNDLHTMWDNRQALLSQCLNLQLFNRDAKGAEVLLAQQENFLAKEEVPTSVDAAEQSIKRLETFLTTLDANDDKLKQVLQYGEKLSVDGHFSADKIMQRVETLQKRRDDNRAKANEQLDKLREQLLLQQFLQDCDELQDWMQDKMVAAQDETYRDAKNIHSKFLRHQAFELELKANKDRLEALTQGGKELTGVHPDFTEKVEPRVEELQRMWTDLERTTEDKGSKLFDANRAQLADQSADDLDGWLSNVENQILTTDVGTDLTTVNILVQQQSNVEREMEMKKQQVAELEAQTVRIRDLDPIKADALQEKKVAIEEKMARMDAPIQERKQRLGKAKMARQFNRDVEDERMWIEEKKQLAMSENYGTSLLSVQMLYRKNNSLRDEIERHEPRILSVADTGRELIAEGHPQSDEYSEMIDDLEKRWDDLKQAVEERKRRLELSEIAHQYFMDASEAESYMAEQELYMMSEERPRDEQGAQNFVKKHEAMERAVQEYADTIRELGERSRSLIDTEHPESEQIAIRQTQVDKSYASLKDLARERRARLEDLQKLFSLSREVMDIEQWIADREVVAGSHELGQDFEHISMLRERFKEFARETESIGSERVQAVNEICDALVAAGHHEAPLIAQWKDGLNEKWQDLLELIDTRTQHLTASWHLHKFFHDCNDTLDAIYEKQKTIPEDVGRDAGSVAALQRKHASFEHELLTLAQQVKQVQEDADKLIPGYSGPKEEKIEDKRQEVIDAWNRLQELLEGRKAQLLDASDLYKFFNMVRDLMLWMDDISRQMKNQEKPRDVSGVELLMNNHQSLHAEIDARAENFTICINLGKDLIQRRHYRMVEVREKLIGLTSTRGDMMECWADRWEHLQLILEVYQFARDASVAEIWLLAQEPYLSNSDLGLNLDEVEKLLKRHEAFEKAAGTQEDRFLALQRLTTFEIREREKQEAEDYARAHPDEPLPAKPRIREQYIEDFPLPEPEPQPEETPESVVPEVTDEPDTAHTEPTVSAPSPQTETASSPTDRPQPAPRQSLPGAQAEGPSEAAETHYEGPVQRKHEMETAVKKASNRHWDKVYCVLHGARLAFYKDQKHAKSQPGVYFKHETPLDLSGASAAPAADYKKKPHVVRLRLNNGGEYLLQTRDEGEMNSWVDAITSACGASGGPSRAQTLPAQGSEKKEKKPFFTMKKK